MLKPAVSEVMLQQTQVNTVCLAYSHRLPGKLIVKVIAYWQRWIERWPTTADLASADVEVGDQAHTSTGPDVWAGSQCCLACV